MATATNTIRLRLNVETDGEGEIKTLGIAEKNLAQAIKFASKETNKASDALEKWELPLFSFWLPSSKQNTDFCAKNVQNSNYAELL